MGQTLVKHGSNIGQTLVKNIGQTLVKHWSNIGQTLVKHWSNIGQTLVKLLKDSEIMTNLLDHPKGSNPRQVQNSIFDKNTSKTCQKKSEKSQKN